MTPQEYLEFTRTTAVYPKDDEHEYLTLGLYDELGEVSGVLKRVIRDDGGRLTPTRREAGLKEVGDCLWYVTMLEAFHGVSVAGWPSPAEQPVTFQQARVELRRATKEACLIDENGGPVLFTHYGSVRAALNVIAGFFSSTLEDVAARNVEKLSQRVQAGTIHGEGDER